jgi:hypothetical protein
LARGAFAVSGFDAGVFGFEGAVRGAGGVAVCCATAGASAKAQTLAMSPAAILAGDERSRAAIIFLFPQAS